MISAWDSRLFLLTGNVTATVADFSIGWPGLLLQVLGTYAILWQMALKKVPLNKAYLFRSLGVVYGMAIACYIFQETITWGNLLGGGIVLGGLLVLMSEKVDN